MTSASAIAILFSGLVAGAAADEEVALAPPNPKFEIKLPRIVLTGVPVSTIELIAKNPDGTDDPSYAGRPLVRGIVYFTRRAGSGEIAETALPPFVAGRLVLETKLERGQKVFVTESEIVVLERVIDAEVPVARVYVSRISRWVSLVPLILAITLCIWLRNVVVALFAGLWSGAVLLTQSHGNFFEGFLRTLDTYVLGELVDPGSGGGHDHMLIILFTFFLGALIGVLSRGGASQALVDRLSRFAKDRERGQLMTWAMGLVIFFDDYANALLVGGTMRPLTDRLKISREKLAFLVDSTAAPIAGLALVSTWVGFEVGQIQEGFNAIQVESVDAFTVFLATIPYRLYPLLLLVFVLLIAYSGNDFGPMLQAEARAVSLNQLSRPGSLPPELPDAQAQSTARRQLIRNALIPIGLLLLLVLGGLWWTGASALTIENDRLKQAGEPLIESSLSTILAHASSNRVLFIASFIASVTAVASVVATRALTLSEGVGAWLEGAKSMFLALVVLVMAWGIATICDGDHLNTAGLLVELTPKLDVKWMPALTFLFAGLVSFATGSSFATMGLLIPLSIAMTWNMLAHPEINEAAPMHYLMLSTIGAVLAGAIFGDHCSPISDTTVLSSAACGCDHLDHVATQTPYALTVAGVALFLGYVPIGLGFKSPQLLLPFALIALYVIVQFLGRPVAEYAEDAEDESIGGTDDGAPVISADLLADPNEAES